ncbi:MAG TPA: hypothetical protein VGU01_02690 [Sphingomicrobium sp.]|nr:hypothetical protein [Sphingomicrobium sp.]
MRMVGNILRFGALLAFFSVAPAAATQRATLHRSPCPIERARAAKSAVHGAPTGKLATTAMDRLVVGDGGVFGPGLGSGFLNP